MHLLAQLTQSFPDIPHLLYWKCEMTDMTLSKIDPEYWNGKCFEIIESNIQKIMSQNSLQNIFSRLQWLVIASDPISNAGIKKLMSHSVNNL